MNALLKMAATLILVVAEKIPALRRIAWKGWYEKIAHSIPAAEWTNMNYGYAPADPENKLALRPEDENDRLCLELYERVLAQVELKSNKILEIGSGRGGGLSYCARYHSPSHAMGIDFSPENIAFSKKRHAAVRNLMFDVGDAEHLKFSSETFDVVLSVESSHCYGDVGKFLAEAKRVLKPGGLFLFADLRTAADMEKLRRQLSVRSWEKIEEEDITARVVAALEQDTKRKTDLIKKLVPSHLISLFMEFAGVAGGHIYKNLTSRKLLYYRFAFLKKT